MGRFVVRTARDTARLGSRSEWPRWRDFEVTPHGFMTSIQQIRARQLSHAMDVSHPPRMSVTELGGFPRSSAIYSKVCIDRGGRGKTRRDGQPRDMRLPLGAIVDEQTCWPCATHSFLMDATPLRSCITGHPGPFLRDETVLMVRYKSITLYVSASLSCLSVVFCRHVRRSTRPCISGL